MSQLPSVEAVHDTIDNRDNACETTLVRCRVDRTTSAHRDVSLAVADLDESGSDLGSANVDTDRQITILHRGPPSRG